MSQISVTALSALLPEDVTASHQIIVFTQDGDTERVALDGAVDQANSNNGCVCIKSASLTITSAQVLALNSTPLTIVAAQGVGTAIEVISASVKIDFNTTAYATNVGVQLICDGADEPQLTSLTALNASVTSTRKLGVDTTFSASDTQVLANADLQLFVPSGDPTAGDSDITVYVLYRVITL
jgi:hypothetical protein